MDIKRRIKKLETKTSASRFCGCFRFNEYYDFLQSGGKPKGYYKFMPDICQTCQKPIDKTKEKEFLEFQKIADERLRQAAKTLAMFEDLE